MSFGEKIILGEHAIARWIERFYTPTDIKNHLTYLILSGKVIHVEGNTYVSHVKEKEAIFYLHKKPDKWVVVTVIRRKKLKHLKDMRAQNRRHEKL